MRIIFASLLLVAYVAIDGGLGLPLSNSGNEVNQPQVSIIEHELLLNMLRQWFPSVLYMMNKSQPNVQTLPTQSDQVASHSETKRSENLSFVDFFFRVVWGLPVLDGGNSETVKQDGMGLISNNTLNILWGLYPPLFLLDYLLLNNLSPNFLTLPPSFDRPDLSDTRSKRTADESWTDLFYIAIWSVSLIVLLLGMAYLVAN